MSDRLEVLALQLQTSWFMLWAGLEGLSEEAYAWQPTPGSWTVRLGPDGRWTRDSATPPPDPRPMATIAWRVCTLAGTQTLRHDWTFGAHSLTWEAIDVPGSVSGGLAFLERSAAAWIQGVAGLTDADLDTALCDWPGGPTGRPFVETLWWTNRELIAAGAEITLLRDIHRAGRPRPG
ncbi:MAG: DinB family protein [Actinomycetota bacterium]|nr:DinB family protein [Actinomycetota bacterium]